MLPYLKNRDDGVGQGAIPTVERKPDEGSEPFDMLDAVAEDLLSAVKDGNKKLLKEALEALCEYMREEDLEQDGGEAT